MMRRLIRPTLKVLVIVVSLFLVGEALQRVKSFGVAGLSYDEMYGMTNLQQSPYAVNPPVESMQHLASWGMLPKQEGVRKGAPFRVNNLGFRGPDAVLEKAPERFRIAVIGGSLSLGSGIAFSDTWPAVLEQSLNAALPSGGSDGRRYEVFNLAMPQTVHGLPRVLRRVLYFQPDLVLWQISEKGSEGKRTGNLMHALEISTERKLPIAAFMLGETEIPQAFQRHLQNTRQTFFHNLGSLGVVYEEEYYLYPEDPHPTEAIHRRIAGIVHEALKPRMNQVHALVAKSQADYRTAWKPPEPIPSANRRNGFWRSYFVKRLYSLVMDIQWSPLGESIP